MTITEALTSGIVQGLTEFLPVSSSGHLVFLHSFFGFKEPNIFFDICLHAGTLTAVVIYFLRDIVDLIRQKNINWLICIIIGSIPAVAAALLFENRIEAFFTDPAKVSGMLIATGFVLFAGQLAMKKRGLSGGSEPAPGSALAVGAAQAFALLPGISRSGMTISLGLVAGIKTEDAYRFSFLLSIPVIAGALLYKVIGTDVVSVVKGDLLAYVAGTVTAFLVGWASLFVLWKAVKGKRLYLFGIYCLLAGSAGLFWFQP